MSDRSWPCCGSTPEYLATLLAVDDIDAMVARMRARGAELIGEMRYEDAYQLAYLRGPEGIIVALAEELAAPHVAG